MAWTTPRTWVTGETVTAAMLNEQIRDNENAVADHMNASAAVHGLAAAVNVLGAKQAAGLRLEYQSGDTPSITGTTHGVVTLTWANAFANVYAVAHGWKYKSGSSPVNPAMRIGAVAGDANSVTFSTTGCAVPYDAGVSSGSFVVTVYAIAIGN